MTPNLSGLFTGLIFIGVCIATAIWLIGWFISSCLSSPNEPKGIFKTKNKLVPEIQVTTIQKGDSTTSDTTYIYNLNQAK